MIMFTVQHVQCALNFAGVPNILLLPLEKAQDIPDSILAGLVLLLLGTVQKHLPNILPYQHSRLRKYCYIVPEINRQITRVQRVKCFCLLSCGYINRR